MVRARHLIEVMLGLVLASITVPTCAEGTKPAEGFSFFLADSFQAEFNRSAGSESRLTKLSCTSGLRNACSYRLGSVAVTAVAVAGGRDLEGLAWICAQDCKLSDLDAGVLQSLRLLAPGQPVSSYLAAVPGRIERVTPGHQVVTHIGPVRVTVVSSKGVGLIARISAERDEGP